MHSTSGICEHLCKMFKSGQLYALLRGFMWAARRFHLLSFLETMRDMHGWVHAWQSIVKMQVSGLLTLTCNGPGSSEARSGQST